jgi:pimeloyl-ACP methyl ester carboxylesterase
MQVRTDVLGHARVGSGARAVIVLNDWMSDVSSSWDAALAYLDRERFSWAFADLRGYGRSRGRAGAFNVIEGASDVLALADALGWSRFAIVGHSMSALVALHLAQHHAKRVERAVLLTPPPPSGFGKDAATIERSEQSRALAHAGETGKRAALAQRFGERLARGWAVYKAARWHAGADPDAAAAYVMMFTLDGVPDPTARVAVPVLAITGEQDFPPLRRAALLTHLSPICDRLEVVALADSGHYPMQEMPPLTVGLVERFLSEPAPVAISQ